MYRFTFVLPADSAWGQTGDVRVEIAARTEQTARRLLVEHLVGNCREGLQGKPWELESQRWFASAVLSSNVTDVSKAD